MKKKWGFWIVGILLGCAILEAVVWFHYKDRLLVDLEPAGNTDWDYSVPLTANLQSWVHKGDLLLVNTSYAIRPEGVKKDIVVLADHDELNSGFVLLDRDMSLSRQVAERFQEMTSAAATEGVHSFLISSGYRDLDKQDELFQEKGADYALPAGHSEHNIGLSLDIGSSLTRMEQAPEGDWLEKNAWKYGFILRYPKDKVDITGIQYEPWHFRYVGLPHSAIMYKKNLVLEQYLQLLREKKEMSFSLNNHDYNIRYYPIASEANIYVPRQGSYVISGDNMQGIIVTASN
ncbi:M15 family metallopeptidase [Paenibacillus bovis]|uniref:D-Ala-D-Ala carboxypeptidase VanY n=1 Tax=Paenibacillus bovis TaxID=1616788 RepID=A0A172ZCP5_9BACL|nr:M15 family metallopeptidase [Paenibacillus bovis]ANF95415.1 D-Ala-D-Ala carboxypeptidase VanY [Paenibacillus bovis]